MLAVEKKTIVHLTASPCFGGPERQMLELGRELKGKFRSFYLTFREEERCWSFVRKASHSGFEASALQSDTPNIRSAYRELKTLLKQCGASILLCHGYKAGLLGRPTARALKIPVIGVSRGWTRESLRVRVFEWLDRINLRLMDHVVCVSQGQAEKVLRAGVPSDRVSVIHNAIRCERFATEALGSRSQLASYFPSPPGLIVGAAGRLSPEKGFEILVQAAAEVRAQCPGVGFVLFGDGPLRSVLERQIAARGLRDWFAMPGFRDDLDELLPSLDLFCSSSYSEGLPNVILEAHAAGVPVVATAVGGTPEVVAEGVTGFLVPAGCASPLAGQIARLASNTSLRECMGTAGRAWVRERFSFPAQAASYRRLFHALCTAPSPDASLAHASN